MRKGITKQFTKEYIITDDAGIDIFCFKINQYRNGDRDHYTNLKIDWDKHPILFFFLDLLLQAEEQRIDRLSFILFREIKRCKEFECDYFKDEVLTREGRYSPALAKEVRLKRKRNDALNYKFQKLIPYSKECNPDEFSHVLDLMKDKKVMEDYLFRALSRKEFEDFLSNPELQEAYINVYSDNAEFSIGISSTDTTVFMYSDSILVLVFIIKIT